MSLRQRLWWLLLISVVALICVGGAWAFRVVSLAQAVQAEARQLGQWATAWQTLDRAQVAPVLQRLRENTAELRALTSALTEVNVALQTWGLTSPLAEGDALIDFAQHTAASAEAAWPSVLAAWQTTQTTPAATWPRALGELCQTEAPRLQTALTELNAAIEARARFGVETLPAALQSSIRQFDAWWPLAQRGLQTAPAVPEALGFNGPRTYLLLIQNQDELRPTGGFISAVGTLTFNQGEFELSAITDSANVDDGTAGPFLPPPAPLARYMGLRWWSFRDANWSPDFTVSAQYAQALYQLYHQQSTAGVLAFNQTTIQMVLRAVGPLTVEGLAAPVTAANVENVLRAAWDIAPGEAPPVWYARRKTALTHLAAALWQRATSADNETAWRAAQAVQAALAQRQLVLYATDPLLAEALSALHWDGAVRPGARDFMMLVDANIGYNRVNPRIAQTLMYHIDLTNSASPLAELTVTYTNTNAAPVPCRHSPDIGTRHYADYMAQCYWDYWRVLLPSETKLINFPSNAVPADQLLTQRADFNLAALAPGTGGTKEVAGIFVLPPGASHTLALAYRLPASVLWVGADGHWHYQLQVQKQTGVNGWPLTVLVQYPLEWQVVTTSLPTHTASPGVLEFALSTLMDVLVEIEFQR